MNIAINGFGRIGRTLLRTIMQDPEASKKLNVAAINVGPADMKAAAHLFQYDSVMGIFPGTVIFKDNHLIVEDKAIHFIAQKDPAIIDWSSYGIEWVVECSGKFTDGEQARKHLQSGAKSVLISAPAKNEDVSIIPGVNDAAYDANKHKIVSLGSCTTNAFIPLLHTLHNSFDITHGFMNTVHAYTSTQALLDNDVGDLRRSRAAALNIVPTSTGAMSMLGKIMPELTDAIAGHAVRVPVADVSMIDITVVVKKPLSVEAIHGAFEQVRAHALQGKLGITHEPLVSSDFRGNSHSVIVDGLLTKVVGSMGKVVGWYDNEWGYSSRLKDFLMERA